MARRTMPAPMVRTADRTLRVLEALAKHPDGLSLSGLSTQLSLNASTCHHLIATLLHAGYVLQDAERGRYRLGAKMIGLAVSVLGGFDLVRESRAILQALAGELQRALALSVLDAGKGLVLYKMEVPAMTGHSVGVGQRVPVHCTAAGKALLFSHSEDEIRAILAAHPPLRHGPHTIVDAGQFMAELHRARAMGYAVDNEEFIASVRCVAVPLFDYNAKVVGAISVGGAAAELNDVRISELGRRLGLAARLISTAMGYGGGPTQWS